MRAAGTLIIALLLAGCGGGAKTADPVATIRSWSQDLSRGDLNGAAGLFAVPSVAQLDPATPAGQITRRAEVLALNRSLPCGARLLNAKSVHGYLDALFLLTNRPGASCDSPGGTARVAFRVQRGRIVEWRRIADEPGDSANGTAPPKAPAAPGAAPSPRARSV